MNTKQIISMLQSRIDKRKASIRADWEFAREYKDYGFPLSLIDDVVSRVKKAEIEQKIDKDILRDLYKLVNREG